MSPSEPADVWWVCCWGHVFAHPLIGAGEQITCPGPDEAGVCGTSFIFEPFSTEQEAQQALNDPARESPRWAPWAR